MKLNKEICSKELPIYDAHYAVGVFEAKEFTHRQLSLMKQENIRVMGLKEETIVEELISAFKKPCGYCFENYSICRYCLIGKKNGKACCELKSYYVVLSAKTKTEFLKHHKKWCKEIGLWQKTWR